MAGWHGHVNGRRDMFKLGYMDAKTYFEGAVKERSVKPLRPRARAMRFLMNVGLELIQGTFMLALTARFVWNRKSLWRCLLPGASSSARSALPQKKQMAPALAVLSACLRRLGLLAEVTGITVASFLLWFTTVDLRLDLSEHLLDLAGIGLGKKRSLQSGASSGQLSSGDDSPVRAIERSRRSRSQPCRARRV